MASTSKSVYNIGISGGGPRATELISALVFNHHAKSEEIKAVEAEADPFITKITVFEQKREVVTGTSIDTNDDAALNTGIWGGIKLAHPERIPEKYESIIARLNDPPAAVADEAKRNPDHADDLKVTNLAARSLFLNAQDCPNGFDTSSACADRGFIGKVHQTKFSKLLDHVRLHVPDIEIEILNEHTVIDIDLTDRLHPTFVVEKRGEAEPQRHTFDLAILANGTTMGSPLDKDVQSVAFSGTPNHEAVGKYLGTRGALDADGRLKSGCNLAVGGLSLSAYDFVPILMQYTDLFKPEGNGYILNECEVHKYRNLLTFISSSNNPAPPRLATSITWPGDARFFDTRHVHAVRLQRGYDWVTFLRSLVQSNTAYELGQHPSEIDAPKSAAERMEDFRVQTEIYHRGRNEKTEWGFLRAGNSAMLHGYGLEKDIGEAVKIMAEEAPLAWRGHDIWDNRRSSLYEPTKPETAKLRSNKELRDSWERLQRVVAASPPEIQSMVASLFASGVARHVQGSFKDITLKEAGKTGLRDLKFDGLIVPPVLTPEADRVLQALHGKVKEIVPGLPHYAKGRFLQTRTGWPINVIDAGMGGQGTLIDSADGGKSLIGQRWGDTNTHASAVHWASRCAPMVQILSMAWSRGHPDPIQKMLEQHRQTTPCAQQFAAEIAKFLPQWREVQERAAFLEACKELTEPCAFRALAAHFGTRQERDAAIFVCGNPAVTRKYRECLDSSPAFDPVSPAEYQERFVDFTDEELEINCKKVAEDINNYC